MNRRCIVGDVKRPMLPAPHRPHAHSWPDTGLHAAWLGHTSVLLKIDGMTVLTDPVFSTRAGIGFGPLTLGLKRIVEPALSLAELPKIDLILLSHAHMDHFDIRSLRRLESPATTVVTAAHTADLLRVGRYAAVYELAWGEHPRVGPTEIRPFPANHSGARTHPHTYRG